MKLLLGIVVGALLATVATATATDTERTFYPERGDTAVADDTAVACTVIPDAPGPDRAGGDAFRCKVGGDYRAKYGVIISDRQVALTQYTAFSRYRIILRRPQSAVG